MKSLFIPKAPFTRRLKSILMAASGILMFMSSFSVSYAQEELPKIKVRMMLEHEGFLMWYAKEKGFDKDFGVDIDLTIVDCDGMEIMNQLKNDRQSWQMTAVSSMPLIIGSKDIPLEIVGVANDESASVSLFTSPQSNLFRVKGWNGDFPDVYGDPELLEGKKFYVSSFTSSAYTLAKYLEIFDLDYADVDVEDAAPDESIESLKNGEGAGGVFWSPDTFDAAHSGLAEVTCAHNIGAEIPLLFMTERRFSKENPKVVGGALAAYLKAVEIQLKDPKSLVKEYQRFYLEHKRSDYDLESCEQDILNHKVFDIDDQLPLFEKTGNRQSKIQKLEATLASSLMLILYESMNQETFCSTSENIKNPRYVTDRYLRIAQKMMDRSQSEL